MKNHFKKDIAVLSELGSFLGKDTSEREAVMESATHHNPWFTRENVLLALEAIASNLQKECLEKWLTPYEPLLRPGMTPLNVGLVLAGNIPLVGFHDILCVLVSGHRAVVKLSSQDNELSSWVIRKLQETGLYRNSLQITERLEAPDAVIATGSNNSARYFERYFGKYPHIIRKNRNSVAILTGKENTRELQELGKDIFSYFGLGCRNVSKLYVPRGYDFQPLLDALEPYREIIQHHKYANNYEYQLTIRLMNNEPHFTNGFLLLVENPSFTSPMATLHYEFYQGDGELQAHLEAQAEQLQCLVSSKGLFPGSMPFGQTQYPALWDYADKVDTLRFLLER
ncbi:MAG: acyl-CoA reductase [Solitalea sp.]